MQKKEVLKKSRIIQNVFLKSEIYRNAECVMLYYPLGNEVDTMVILQSLFDDKKTAVFPVTEEKTNEITPVIVNEKTDFSKGAYSVFEPSGGRIITKEKIDVIIVPGICFSKNGARIGFGKGCYDRFLDGTNAVKIGFCYDVQISCEGFGDKFDVEVDYLITESGMICCE